MKKLIASMLIAAAFTSTGARAQGGPSGGGPGPGPVPSPWIVNGNSISYAGGVLLPSNVAGGNKGGGTINVSNGYYINGALVTGLPAIASHDLLCNLTGGVAIPTQCSWTSFADVAVGNANGNVPSRVSGAWTAISTGASGHALPFLDGANAFSAVQTFSLSASVLPAVLTGTVGRFINATGTATRLELDAYGAQAFFTTLCANGTPAAPTTLTAATQCGGYNMHGYDGTAYAGPAATFRTFANQNWAVGAHGTYAEIAVTANGSTALTTALRFENDGGITVTPAVTGGSKGAGTINAAGLYVNGVAVTGAGITALTGDVTATGPGSVPATLSTAQPAVHTWALPQTFTVAPVFTDQSGSRTALGLGTAATQNTGTSGANLPFLNGNNTWGGTNAFAAITATSFNKLTMTQPATGSTLTIADGKTLTDTSAIGASVLLGAAGGGFSAYAGGTCSNQFVRSLSAAAAPTCNSVAFADIASAAVATTSQWRADTAGLLMTTDQVWASGAAVTLTDASTVTPDLSTGLNFTWTLGATGRTLASPTNVKVGQTGVIQIVEDGTGSRTITTYGGTWKFSGGTKPTLTTTAGAVDLFAYFCYATTACVINAVLNVQ